MVGGVLQLAVQMPALRRIGCLPRIGLAPGRIARRLAPSRHAPGAWADGAGAARRVGGADLAADQHADRVAPGVGAVSWLTYADRLMEFPTALLGVALGVVLMPQLSAAQAPATTRRPIRAMLDWGLRLVVLLALPCAVALLVFAQPLVAVLFHYGRFTRQRRARNSAGADRLRRRPARPGGDQGAGAGLLRPPGHAHAGAHRRRRAGDHAAAEPRAGAVAAATRRWRCRSASARWSTRPGCWSACCGAAATSRQPGWGVFGLQVAARPRRRSAARWSGRARGIRLDRPAAAPWLRASALLAARARRRGAAVLRRAGCMRRATAPVHAAR